MATDRYQMEQEAQKHLSKGNMDKAITTYAALLRQDPQDRRVRQKIAGLYESVGRKREAEKHYRELVRLYTTDGNQRALMATLKQLRKLTPQDGGVMGMLARAYRASNLSRDAIHHFEQAINLLGKRDPKEAAVFAQELQELKPGDTPLRLRTAELLAAAKDEQGAYEAYRDLIGDLRRHGKLNEVGRVAALALQIKPDEGDLLCDAAESALAGGEPQTALGLLQPAYAENPHELRTLDLLARVFEETDEAEKALGVLLALAKELSLRGDYPGRLAALERAAKHGEDKRLKEQLAKARASAKAAAFRLGDLPSAQPEAEEEMRAVVRASVMLGYGLWERAQEELDTLPDDSLAGRAWNIEALAAQGETGRAMELARALEDAVPAEEARRVGLRLAVLDGQPLEAYLDDLEALLGLKASPESTEKSLDDEELIDDDEELIDDDEELIDDDEELIDDDEELIDDDEDLLDDEEELIDDADTDNGEGTAEEEASPADPEPSGEENITAEAEAFFETAEKTEQGSGPDEIEGGDGLLSDLFGDLGPTTARPKPKPKPKAGKVPEFSSPNEDEFSSAMRRDPLRQAGRDIADDPLADTCALLEMGLFGPATKALEGVGGLRATALRALARAGEGDLSGARESLLDAVDEVDEGDPEFPAALFHLAGLSARVGKTRRAIRQLKEVADLAPEFRPVEVQLRLRALEGLERG